MSEPVAFPELVTGRLDGVVPGRWSVREGSVARGTASCDLAALVLEIPLARTPQARVVRAHELMHARVSPLARHLVRSLEEVTPRALECAEEARVNALLSRLGFDVALLCDGTEKGGGRRLGEVGAWSEAVCFAAAVLDTGAERTFLTGVRQSRPEWVAALRAVQRRVRAILASLDTPSLADTRCEEEYPRGYARATLPVARILTVASAARVPVGAEELRGFRRALEPGGRRPATGAFAPLVLDECGLLPRGRDHSPVRRFRAAAVGTTMRYPSRFVTDSQRRAFAQRGRARGGVVVVDQSGSMEIAVEELAGLLRAAPGALVVGYSHRPGDLGGTPNAWLLAARGRSAAPERVGNVGNGVDGPVLRWALAHRRANEPVVWVTDGQVTDAHDHPADALSRECAALVRRHRIRLARDLAEALRALRGPDAARRPDFRRFGRVGRVLLAGSG